MFLKLWKLKQKASSHSQNNLIITWVKLKDIFLLTQRFQRDGYEDVKGVKDAVKTWIENMANSR